MGSISEHLFAYDLRQAIHSALQCRTRRKVDQISRGKLSPWRATASRCSGDPPPKQPRDRRMFQMIGFQWCHAASASAAQRPATISGGSPNPSGTSLERASSRRIFHRVCPPIRGGPDRINNARNSSFTNC